MTILEMFDSSLSAALLRYQHWKNPEARDLQRIFGPVFTDIANVAGSDPNRATELISAWDPTTITVETVRGAVAQLTAPTMSAMELARRRTAALLAEVAADAAAHPLTARDRVLLDRKKPLGERSRQSIEDEIYEANTGKTRDGVALPQVNARHWAALESHYTALEQELEKRDCAIAGVTYSGPPVKHTSGPVGYAMPSR